LGLNAIHFLGLRRERGGWVEASVMPYADMNAGLRQYECLEAGCRRTLVAENDEELVEVVQRHVREAHGSVELEDVILSGAAPVDETVARDD
jgi:predicted small metal-binding protein